MNTHRIIYSLLFVFILLPNALKAQSVEKTLYVEKAGSLISELTLEEANSITHLTLTGKINAIDFKHLRDEFHNLQVLDLSAVDIKNYVGKKGTIDSFTIYSSNVIPAHAFSEKTNYDPKGKPSLKKIILPHNINAIEKFAFANCPNLEILICARGDAPNLSDSALSPQRTAIFVPAGSKENYTSKKNWSEFAIIDNNPVTINLTLQSQDNLADLLSQKGIQPKDVNFLTLSGKIDNDDVKLIRDYMANLVSIDLRNTNMTEIPEYTFAQKTCLITAYLPNQLKGIGTRAFDNCNKLGPVLTLPATLTSIGYGAFINCFSLDVVRAMGNHITAIGEDLFGEGVKNKLVYNE